MTGNGSSDNGGYVERERVLRLAKYKNVLYRLRRIGFVKVYSENIADAAGESAVRVRKDFSHFGITGKRKGGYVVEDLVSQINAALGKDAPQKLVVVGAGKIGLALMEYEGFGDEGLRITAAFDINPAKIDERRPIPILPMGTMEHYLRDNGIRIAINAVPAPAAQQVCDSLVAAGIVGILNFAPVPLNHPPHVFVSDVNLAGELESLAYFARRSGTGTCAGGATV